MQIFRRKEPHMELNEMEKRCSFRPKETVRQRF